MEYKNLTIKLKEIGERIANEYKEELQDNKKIATGKLYNSIDYKIIVSGNNIKLLFVAEDYFINVEDGRGAGEKMPPIDKIKSWMKAKGINRNPYLIARSISLKGIRGIPKLNKIRTENRYSKEITEAIKADIKLIDYGIGQ